MPTSDPMYNAAVWVAFALVVGTVIAAPFVPSPYGRFSNRRLGPAVNARLGWFLMELPATLSFFTFYALGPGRAEPVALFVAGVWSVHYLNRGVVMPLLMRVPAGQGGTFGLMVVSAGWLVTSLHGYLNATWVTTFHPNLSASWFSDPRFIVGSVLYAGGLIANIHADYVLRNLRSREEVARGERPYRIPYGGLFRYVTNASYLAELVAWAGFALVTWSPGGVFIFCISAANLVPRAVSIHRWYREKFPAYPTERRALVPFLF